jgi:protoporphyrinogen oxidase
MKQEFDALIIGAGMAGLTAANHLEEYHLNTLVLEASDRAGGRVKTISHEGFRLDHGFQTLLTSYPMAKKYLNYEALNLRSFDPGALCFGVNQKYKVYDVNRKKSALFSMAISPIGSFMDKIRLGNLTARIKKKTLEEIFDGPNISTQKYLKELGFSSKIIERFFRPFYSGIFLENKLETSARIFEFTFKMFAEGEASIPAKGIGEIPKQLKEKLSRTQFRFNTKVNTIKGNTVVSENGDEFRAKQIIIACPLDDISPQVQNSQEWNHTEQFYFSADNKPFKDSLIALNFKEESLVNNIAVLTNLSSALAPKGKELIQVSLNTAVARKSQEEAIRAIKDELALNFGVAVQDWQFLRSFYIPKALPRVINPANEQPFEQSLVKEGIYSAGDQMLNPSLNAAMLSGELAAKALVLNHVKE